jgi:hypothetical protein
MSKGRKKAAVAPRQVETLTHKEARRKNIPTAELRSAAQRAEEIAPFAPVVYPRRYPLAHSETRPRDSDLDPQLIWKGARVRLTAEQIKRAAESGYIDLSDAQLTWRGKDQQDWSDLVVNAPPLYIQEKIHPKAILREHPQARLLLTTFSLPLANALEGKLRILTGESSGVVPRVTVLPFRGVANELFTLAFGHHPRAASEDQIRAALKTASNEASLSGFTPRFLASEWLNVVDAWQLDSLHAYQNVPRLGRKNRLGAKQREKLWPLFVRARQVIEAQGLLTWPSIFGKVTAHFAGRADKPFSHAVIDEAQDLGVPELRMLAAVIPDGPNALFFAGDLGQRIFQEPFSWKALGVDIRGRSLRENRPVRLRHQNSDDGDRNSHDMNLGRIYRLLASRTQSYRGRLKSRGGRSSRTTAFHPGSEFRTSSASKKKFHLFRSAPARLCTWPARSHRKIRHQYECL